MAPALLEDDRARGTLVEGQTIVTACDTPAGVGLAIACAHLGHPLVVVTHARACREWRSTLKHLGATVVASPPTRGRKGAFRKAWRLANENDWHLLDQASVTDPALRARTVCREILEDFPHGGPDYVFAGHAPADVGEIAKILRRESDTMTLLACRPEDVLADGTRASYSPLPVGDDAALQTACDAMMREGIFCGRAAGRALAAALAFAAEAPAGSRILCLLPDIATARAARPRARLTLDRGGARRVARNIARRRAAKAARAGAYSSALPLAAV